MTQSHRSGAEALPDMDVAIVGAGPVGLMIANLLGLAGLQVTVLEANEGLFGLSRAIAYDGQTLRLFDQIGLFDVIAAELVRNPKVRYLNARGRTLMHMDLPVCGSFGHSALGTFYQPDFEKALLDGLSRFSNVRVRFGHKVTSLVQGRDDATLTISTIEGERLPRAQFVVGCDGGTSRLRDMIGSQLLGATFVQRWLAVDAIVKNHNVGQISFYCDPRRPCVELPAVGDRVRWEFMQLPGEDEAMLRSDETIRALIAEKGMDRAFSVERKAIYTFHTRVADRWRNKRALLAGDAAHLMPPFAGQGMNSGLRYAVNLAWKLAAVVKGVAAETILDSYEAERASAVRKAVDVSRRLGAIIMPTRRSVAAARDTVFALLNLSRAFRALVERGGVVPAPTIGRSALTGTRRDAVIGQMMPQPSVNSPKGRVPLDRFLTCHQWMVIGVGVDPCIMLSARDLAILEALDTRFICLNGGGDTARTLALRCDDPDFAAWVKSHSVRAVLVRPDRFIADRLDPPGRDLLVLDLFAQSCTEALPRIAA